MSAATELRSDLATLTRSASNDLAALWRQVGSAAQAEVALRDILPDVIETYGAAAATVAADWYDDQRDKAGVGRRFVAIPAEIPEVGAQALVGWALTEAQDMAGLERLILGGTQRRIVNFSRVTVMRSSIADPSATGWQRTGSGSCAFCALLIGRGAVYTEASADFASHDHCNCSASPAFAGESKPVKPYTPGPRQGNKADYARARAYIAEH